MTKFVTFEINVDHIDWFELVRLAKSNHFLTRINELGRVFGTLCANVCAIVIGAEYEPVKFESRVVFACTQLERCEYNTVEIDQT